MWPGLQQQMHSQGTSLLFGSESGIPACSHMLLSIHRLQRCEATILPLSSTCFLGTVELTVSSALCLSLPTPPPPPLLCLWGCLAAFPSFCSHAPFAFVCRTAIGWCTFLVLFLCRLIPLPQRKRVSARDPSGAVKLLWRNVVCVDSREGHRVYCEGIAIFLKSCTILITATAASIRGHSLF